MIIITPGHKYELENFENKSAAGQQIQFIEKCPGKTPSDEHILTTVNDGTTNEELLAVLIDRLEFLYAKFPSRETAVAKTKLEEALMWLEKRTRDRQARGVEGKALA